MASAEYVRGMIMGMQERAEVTPIDALLRLPGPARAATRLPRPARRWQAT
jgi:hypothetical protein